RRKYGVAVAELRGVIDLDRNARQFLDQVFGHHRRVPGCAAGGNLDVGEAAELRAVNSHRVQEYSARIQRDAALRGIAYGSRLLVNLFEHEMLEPAFFGLDRVPVDALDLRLDPRSLPVSD